MKITEEYIENKETKYVFEYNDTDSFEHLPFEKCKQCYAVCFCDDKMVIGFGGHKKSWGLIGGTIENDESFEETLKREIKEESNMEVLSFIPIGYQKVTNTQNNKEIYQLRYVCFVKPYGLFILDPADNGITEIKLIDPKDYKHYFDWGKIGERIITRSLELKTILENK
jgi:NUDIX domain